MKETDTVPKKGIGKKMISVLIVSLFITSSFCVMFTTPVESETVMQNDSTFIQEIDDFEDSMFGDIPNATAEAADFTKDPKKALETLNLFARSEALCEWNADTKTLTIAPIDFHRSCARDSDDVGAAIVLPAGSTVDLEGPSRVIIDIMESANIFQAYGLYCEGDLTFNTNYYTIEFVLQNIEKGRVHQMDKFSAGLYIGGKLTVNGEKTGRLAVRSGNNNCTAVIGLYAKEGLVVNNSEMLISANIGKCTKEGDFGFYCTIGIYSPSITIDCMDCQKIWVKGGLNDKYNEESKSCGIVTNKMEVKHGNVIAKGGNHFELNSSIGIQFIGEGQSLTGKGTVNANGGTSGVDSKGIVATDIFINIAKLNASGSYSGDNIIGIRAGNIEMKDTIVDITVGNVNQLRSIRGIWSDGLKAVNCDFNIVLDSCDQVWCTLIKDASFTGCRINALIKNCPYNTVVDAYGMCGEQLEISDCDVNIKLCDSRFDEAGINVPFGPEGKGWLIINNSKVLVEMGNDVGVDSVLISGVVAFNMKVTNSELYVKSGNSDSSSWGVRMNGGEAIIEHSKVTVYGGDIISDEPKNANPTTLGFETSGSVTIILSEVCFYGGETKVPNGRSYGLSLTSKDHEQEIKIVNSKFDANGVIVENKDNCKFTCPQLYGKNKNTGDFEKFDINNIANYTEIATSNWIDDKKTDSNDSIWLILTIIAVIVIFLAVVAFVVVRHHRS